MNYTITAYSTALFSTWINVEELNLLIDCGDGACTGLLQKSRKVKHVFITHPDRDHLTGLPQFLQLNARADGLPHVYYPKDSGSFPALNDFLNKFDPHIETTQWIPIKDQSAISIKKNIEVRAQRNEHVVCPMGVHKSLSYKVYEIKHKLKPAFQALSGQAIKNIVADKGRDFITEAVATNIIAFSGDTPVDDYAKWEGAEILMHEATFLNPMGNKVIKARGNKHSRVDEVLKMAKEIQVQQLILNHFSSRYSRIEIDAAVHQLIKTYQLQIPVYLVYPGELKRDILNTPPINA